MYNAPQKSTAQQDELPIRDSRHAARAGGLMQLQNAVISGVGTGKALAFGSGEVGGVCCQQIAGRQSKLFHN